MYVTEHGGARLALTSCLAILATCFTPCQALFLGDTQVDEAHHSISWCAQSALQGAKQAVVYIHAHLLAIMNPKHLVNMWQCLDVHKFASVETNLRRLEVKKAMSKGDLHLRKQLAWQSFESLFSRFNFRIEAHYKV